MSTVTITARPAADAGPAGVPRTAFVLAGGTALGALQAGIVRALYERGIVPGLLAAPRPGP
jgi:predicted acylesterase/phospholipase RssA